MKHTLEKLWDEYFAEECAVIDTEEERMFLRKAAEVHKKASELLTKEQNNAIEKYTEALYDIQAYLTKKAFFKGCEFTISLFVDAGNFGKK